MWDNVWVHCKAITVLQHSLHTADDRSAFVCRFILENWVLDRWVRNIVTVYPVVIVALVGNIWKHFNPADPTANAVFMGKFVTTSDHNCDFANTSPTSSEHESHIYGVRLVGGQIMDMECVYSCRERDSEYKRSAGQLLLKVIIYNKNPVFLFH